MGCLDGLETYVSDQLAGIDYRQQHAQIAQHLDACVACSEAYGALYRSHMAVPNEVSIPAPQLGFLTPRISLKEILRAAIQHVGEQVRITFSSPLLAAVRATAPATPALRGSTVPLMDLKFHDVESRIDHVAVQVYAEQPQTCLVRVQVSMSDREWPDLESIQVRLNLPTSSYSGHTDPWGEVVFPAIERDQLGSLGLEIDIPAPMS